MRVLRMLKRLIGDITMSYTDGLIIRCLDCGALNIILSTYELGDRKKCLSCGSLVYINSDSFVYKQSPGVIP